MLQRAKAKVREVPASIAWGTGLLLLSLGLIGVSLLFHWSPLAIVLTWVMFFSTGIGGWLIGRGVK